MNEISLVTNGTIENNMFSWTVDNMCSTLRRLINDVIIIIIIVISNLFLVLRFSIFFNLEVVSDIDEQSTACVP